jgi:hypothetical protein
MIKLKKLNKSEILDYYQKSDLYLNEEFIDDIIIQEDKYLPINEISTDDQLDKLLDILQYWGFNHIPDFILKYIIDSKKNIQLDLYPKKNYYYENKLLSFGDIINLIIKTYKYKVMSILAEIGHIDIFIFCHKYGFPLNRITCKSAALNGHLECLKYAHENDCPWIKKHVKLLL